MDSYAGVRNFTSFVHHLFQNLHKSLVYGLLSILHIKLFKNGQNFDAYFVNQEFIQFKFGQIFEVFYIRFERTRTKFRLQASSF